MKLTPIQKLREDIRDLDPLLYIRVLTLLIEAEGQEKEFLEEVFNDGMYFDEFEEYYKQFGMPK